MTCPHCADKDDRIAWLEGELGLRVTAGARHALCRAFIIRPSEATILARLYAAKGNCVSTWILMDETARSPGRDDRGLNNISVLILRLRRALGREAIETVYAAGYRLSAAGMAKVSSAIEAESISRPRDPRLVNDGLTTRKQARGSMAA